MFLGQHSLGPDGSPRTKKPAQSGLRGGVGERQKPLPPFQASPWTWKPPDSPLLPSWSPLRHLPNGRPRI